jgi:ribonuclease P protein component
VKRTYRLRRPYQFQRVRREGRTVSHHLLLLNFAASRRKQPRYGFVVGKRIGKAVERNRAKRRVREAVRLVMGHISPGMDLVFVIRTADVTRVPFTRLQSVVEKLLRRADLWCDTPMSAQALPFRDEADNIS